MKHPLLLLAAALATVALAACHHTDDSSLRQAAQAYLDAAANDRLDEALQRSTPSWQETLTAVATVVENYGDSASLASDRPATVTITATRFLSDTSATVAYHKKTPRRDIDRIIEMRLRDGQWLAHRSVRQMIPPDEEK